ncbi:hypothetical protein AWE51_08795 [Aquimarina aggregata]|uniref:Uncharacterized protein n=1 Tax=Aquimarina aggregata TaxID=1642818 RepID=A0A162ZDV8_9FLAO|nr:hypothetical protein [Aquimarina aggregata]KZS39738.1 hypothetical protein AWE51_08795 [Aquimarina aggregata]
MDFKTIVHNINTRQIETFSTVQEFRSKTGISILSRKHRGLYWLWTNLDFSTLKKCTTKPNTKEVPIASLVSNRDGLKNICDLKKGKFRVVYNGIGGYHKTPPSFGLRERINQELYCNDPRTGTLNILNRDFKPEHWAVSFFDFDDPYNTEIVNVLKSENPYIAFAKELETVWRLEFGMPILCRY